jgi:hypothetical protein
VAQGAARLVAVREHVAALLAADPDECVIDALVTVDLMMECSFEQGWRPVRLRVERRAQERRLWLTVFGCPPGVEENLTDLDRTVLGATCDAWGVVAGTPDHTLWADLRLQPADVS